MNYSILRDGQVGNIGKQLKLAREERGWHLNEAAKRTGIKVVYLEALEEEKFQQIPSGLYAKKYLAKYTKVLNISLTEMVNELDPDNNNPFQKKIVSRKQLLSFPKIIRRFFLILIIFLCSLYLFFYFKKMFFPPKITIYYPEKNLITHEQTIIVSGKVAPETDLKINDESIPKDQENNFSQKVSLKKGINQIIIKAKKKYSQEKIIIRQILVE